MAENLAKLSAAHPACKLIVRTFEESKFHAHTIMIKFGVEITTAPLWHKKRWKETEERGFVLGRGRWTKTALGLPKVGHSLRHHYRYHTTTTARRRKCT